jgi:hypothetical protein
LDSSVTVWCGSTTMVFCLPKPRFVDYLLVRCTFLISQPTIWGKPTQFWIGWIYIYLFMFFRYSKAMKKNGVFLEVFPGWFTYWLNQYWFHIGVPTQYQRCLDL